MATANPAAGLRLSLDLELSRIAKAALETARGSVVLLDPRTGGVLAAVSDPVTERVGGTPAFEDRREPASISKIVTTAAALRAGIDPDTFLKRLECRGAERIGRGTVWCSYPAGPLSASTTPWRSAATWPSPGSASKWDETRSWASWPAGASVWISQAGRREATSSRPRATCAQLADVAIGLEATDLTPLHGALMAAVIADEGHMPAPVLVLSESGPLSLISSALPRPAARDVIDAAAVRVLAHAMAAVPLHGTAAGVSPADFPIAMKTGTGATWHLGYHANYIGVAPWPNPIVAFSVRVTHEPTSSRVNRTARVVLGRLLEELQRSLCSPDAPPVSETATRRWKPEAGPPRPSVCS